MSWGSLTTVRARVLCVVSAIWTIAFLVVIPLVLDGRVKGVPFQAYMAAGQRWLEHAPLYDLTNIDGFQYLPQSAAFFSLLVRVGTPTADVLWRAMGWIGLATGQWRLARRLLRERLEAGFVVATCLTALQACNALGNGQANLMLAALCLHATIALISQRFWSVAALLSLGLALKPLMLVPLLVVITLYPATRWRTGLWMCAVALFPLIARGVDYAIAQYDSCIVKLRMCADPNRLFEDLASMLASFGLRLSSAAYWGLRSVFALLVLCACLLLRRRLPEPFATTSVMGLTLGYLMLFNPRTLSSSYVMVAAFAAPLAAAAMLHGAPRRAMVLGACVVAWNLNHHVFGFAQHWLNPLACLVFCAELLCSKSFVREDAAELTCAGSCGPCMQTSYKDS